VNEQKSLIYRLAETYERYRADRRATQAEQPAQLSRPRRLLRWLTPNGGTLLLAAILVVTAQVWASPLASPAAVTRWMASTA
jgi:hypothetical protein